MDFVPRCNACHLPNPHLLHCFHPHVHHPHPVVVNTHADPHVLGRSTRQVYITDDGRQVGFYKFVADRAGNLSTGTLYAARFNQSSDANGGVFAVSHGGGALPCCTRQLAHDAPTEKGPAKSLPWQHLPAGRWSSHPAHWHPTRRFPSAPPLPSCPPRQISWVSLGRTDHAILASELPKTNFSSIFDYMAPSNGTCPAGYTAVKHSYGEECLALKEGMEMHAAGFETRR